jgi:hypothetical protein
MFAGAIEEIHGRTMGITFRELGIVLGIGIPPGQFGEIPRWACRSGRLGAQSICTNDAHSGGSGGSSSTSGGKSR